MRFWAIDLGPCRHFVGTFILFRNYQMLFLLLYRFRYDLVTVLEIEYNLVVLYLFNYLRDDYIIEL